MCFVINVRWLFFGRCCLSHSRIVYAVYVYVFFVWFLNVRCCCWFMYRMRIYEILCRCCVLVLFVESVRAIACRHEPQNSSETIMLVVVAFSIGEEKLVFIFGHDWYGSWITSFIDDGMRACTLRCTCALFLVFLEVNVLYTILHAIFMQYCWMDGNISVCFFFFVLLLLVVKLLAFAMKWSVKFRQTIRNTDLWNYIMDTMKSLLIRICRCVFVNAFGFCHEFGLENQLTIACLWIFVKQILRWDDSLHSRFINLFLIQ